MSALMQQKELAMSTDELLQAQVELYHHSFAFVKSLALKAATDLCIPDAIQHLGGAATLSDLAAETGIHPTKLSNLRRLMRVLTTSGVFSVTGDHAGAVYKLTRVSRLLVVDRAGGRTHLSPVVSAFVSPYPVTTLFSMREWFTDERAAAMSLFEVAHGCTLWEAAAMDGTAFNAAMAADSRFTMENLLLECGSVFETVRGSLVDVGGGHGAAAAAIARAFPHVKCTVLDLPHVVATAPTDDKLTFVGGDMFDNVPPADAVLLKWVLHDWQHEDCVKILRRCKEAIPARNVGGTVIIVDTVIGSAGSQQGIASKETEVLFDVFMMAADGVEREEHEWSKIFIEAGFTDYKITPTMGLRSIIELYP
ncbi:acetylserotonin O-methyltransferase 1 [Aegilops tauschii subsp. strangulata]|nr:acetylserotonin O-methyltransferase 1 [Aegilops tauschii subsp. strangulata]